MEVPIGFLAKLWSFISFLPFFFILLMLGILKAAVIGPVVAVIIFVGNSAVIVGLWPAHFIWTHYCVIKTKRLGLVLKVLVLPCLPVPLLLWPVFSILGSLLVGIGYGYFTPLIATFEAVGEGVINKLYHCFADGCIGTIKGACTLVRDFTDFCFHSYFSFMDDLSEKIAEDEKPMDIKYGILHLHENSLQMGLAYIVSIVSIFDEYTNDLLYLREGSYLPRPKYRKAQVPTENIERENQTEQNKNENENVLSAVNRTRLVSERTKTLKKAIQQLRPIQIWDWLFRSCELNGRVLLAEGLISLADIEECIIQGNCKKLSIKLPAWCILQCLLRSAKSDSHGLLISDEVEVTNFNWPKDKVLDWILGPLLIMKEQIKRLQLDENEESCLMKLIMVRNGDKPEDWDDSGFSSDDNVRRAQLQAIFRRLQGIVANMSRIPSFRRRFNNLIKTLYLEAIESGTLSRAEVGSKSRGKINRLIDSREMQNRNTESEGESNWPETAAALHGGSSV
ncbi:uncharacterized membrane protein At3g27390 isoform X2 [Elaeis guineensis]|uniref:uncharacterized membrane protein At3g27390 isoform X2 n=1 Tax=Elaeis guineensis var. tenera TaxID=51953 RepID=UPI003C6DAB19